MSWLFTTSTVASTFLAACRDVENSKVPHTAWEFNVAMDTFLAGCGRLPCSAAEVSAPNRPHRGRSPWGVEESSLEESEPEVEEEDVLEVVTLSFSVEHAIPEEGDVVARGAVSDP